MKFSHQSSIIIEVLNVVDRANRIVDDIEKGNPVFVIKEYAQNLSKEILEIKESIDGLHCIDDNLQPLVLYIEKLSSQATTMLEYFKTNDTEENTKKNITMLANNTIKMASYDREKKSA